MKQNRVKFVSKKKRGVVPAKVVKPVQVSGPVKRVFTTVRDFPSGDVDDVKQDEEEEDDELVPLEIQQRDHLQEALHWSKKPLADMTARDWRIAMEDFEIKSSSFINPLRSWQESPLDGELVHMLTKWGLRTPTGIQRGAIPPAIDGKDLLCLAPTGSGKSLAFCLPLMSKLLKMGERDTPRGLILTPTRELAVQIEEQIVKFGSKLRTCCIIGGRSYQSSLDKIELGVDIVVATPGRLIDTVKLGHLSITSVENLIIDEADQMITMGFQLQLEEILNELPKKRQTCMFSATMAASVEELTAKYLNSPVKVQVGEVNKVVDTIHEVSIPIPNEAAKFDSLIKELRRCKNGEKVIIFVNFQATCDDLQGKLKSLGVDSITLHGGKSQSLREEAIDQFRDHCDILIATDVAGRGVDLDVQIVINYHEPKNDEQYTHRVGRTGRAGKQGKAINFVLADSSR